MYPEVQHLASVPISSSLRFILNWPVCLKGSGLSGIVRIRYILPNKADFEPCWPVLQKYLATVLPAATVFEAGLLDEKMKIEIEVTAKLNANP